RKGAAWNGPTWTVSLREKSASGSSYRAMTGRGAMTDATTAKSSQAAGRRRQRRRARQDDGMLSVSPPAGRPPDGPVGAREWRAQVRRDVTSVDAWVCSTESPTSQ